MTLAELRALLNDARTALRAAADAVAAAPDTTTEEELRALETAFDTAEAEERRLTTEEARAARIEEARNAQPVPIGPIRVVREPLTYQRHDLHTSYLLDLARSDFGRGDVAGARSRLARHADEMQVEMTARLEQRDREFRSGLDGLLQELADVSPAAARALEREGLVRRQEQRAVSRTDGAVGELVPPLWLLDEYAGIARAGRPFANECRNIPLPPGTDSINVPLLTTGTLTAPQTADNAAVSSQDLASSSVEAKVRTIAGQEDVSIQLLDQSPIAFDEIVFADLLADYALQLDTQLLNGSGINGQLLGILNTVGVNTETYTDASPTLPELWPKLWEALNKASNARKMPATHWWWNSRRWFWAAAQLDGSNRPFVLVPANGPQNALAVGDGNQNQGGPVTHIGAPVYLDLNIPTNLGGGTNEDRAIATRMADHILFEGDVNVRVLKEVLSGTLGVRFQAYGYCAFTAGRFPSATTVCSGTGFSTPTF